MGHFSRSFIFANSCWEKKRLINTDIKYQIVWRQKMFAFFMKTRKLRALDARKHFQVYNTYFHSRRNEEDLACTVFGKHAANMCLELKPGSSTRLGVCGAKTRLELKRQHGDSLFRNSARMFGPQYLSEHLWTTQNAGLCGVCWTENSTWLKRVRLGLNIA